MSSPQEDNISTNMQKSKSFKRAVKIIDLKAKYRVLSMINEHKTDLFGPISDKLTKDTRTEKWKQIFAFASSLGVVPVCKDYMYVRDVFWQNCKKYSIAKLENCLKGNPCKLTACDKISLDIIGRGTEAEVYSAAVNSRQNSTTICSVSSTISVTPERTPVKRVNTEERPSNTERPSLSAKKQKLVIEHLELINHKAKLEIALMEKQLGYPPSIFTKELCERVDNDTADVAIKLESTSPQKWEYEEEGIEGTDDESDVLDEKDSSIPINLL